MFQEHYLALGGERCLRHILFTQEVHSVVLPLDNYNKRQETKSIQGALCDMGVY